MKKDKQLVSGATIEVNINNGKLSILIKLTKLLLKESAKSLVYTSIDHSTFDQECQ